MIRINKTLLSFTWLSLFGLIDHVDANVSFTPPTAQSFKEALKTLPGKKRKPKEIANNTSQITSTSLAAEDLELNLKDPVFTQGVLKTSQGGVITAEGIRIQAQNLEYTNKIENGVRILKVVAEGELMMEFGGRIFVGDKLEFDFHSKTGTLWNGCTDVDIWFLGGDKIELQKDGSYYI